MDTVVTFVPFEDVIPLNNPNLRVRVVALFRGKEPGPFAFLQGMRSGILKRLNSDPEKTETAMAYRRKESCVTIESNTQAHEDMEAIRQLMLKASGIEIPGTLSGWSEEMKYLRDAE